MVPSPSKRSGHGDLGTAVGFWIQIFDTALSFSVGKLHSIRTIKVSCLWRCPGFRYWLQVCDIPESRTPP